jgi:glutaredoxin-like protein NrdH
MIKIYTNPNCVQCDMTKKQFDKRGIEYESIDLSTVPELLEQFKAEGYMAAPVVVTNLVTWAGFKPELISQVAHPSYRSKL